MLLPDDLRIGHFFIVAGKFVRHESIIFIDGGYSNRIVSAIKQFKYS
jgi:hypothetical protein